MSSDERQAKLEEELLKCCESIDENKNFDRVRELVETHRVNVNCVDKDGMTPLMWAALLRHVHIARFLLGNGADVHAADNDGETALSHEAVDSGYFPMAELLLEHDANVETRISFKTYEYSLLVSFKTSEYSLLGWEIYTAEVEMVALLLRFRANTEETLFKGKTYSALYIACWWSSMEIVQLLLDHNDGVDINAFVARGHEHYGSPAMSPLCKVLCQPGNCQRESWRNKFETVQLLIQRGARVIYNGVYPDAPCPLVHAVEHGTMALLRFLLDQTNLQQEMVGNDNNHPLSPALDSAIRGNKLKAAQLLVDRGANVNDRAFSFLHRFARYGMDEGRVCFLLRAAGANVNLAERTSGETALWAAAKKGHVEMVKEFLKAGADICIRDNKNGETPLAVAYRRGHKDIVYLLLRTSPQVWPKLQDALL